MQPLNDRLIVRRLEQEPKANAIVLTDAPPSKMCEVVVCGPGKWMKSGWRRPIGVKPGDVVYVPGIALDSPDWQKGVEFLIQEADIGFIVEQEEVN